MRLREIPGALALGLVASLLAHTALYGGEHAMGGAYNALLVQLAAAGSAGFVAFLGGLAWTGSRATADGSILAVRLAAHLPGLAALTASAGGWFALGEWVEAPHAGAGLLPIVALLIAAAWLLRTLASAAARLLAGAVIPISSTPFAPREVARIVRDRRTPTSRRTPQLRRRFARPPPIANARA